jgi:hypothetical protein
MWERLPAAILQPQRFQLLPVSYEPSAVGQLKDFYGLYDFCDLNDLNALKDFHELTNSLIN